MENNDEIKERIDNIVVEKISKETIADIIKKSEIKRKREKRFLLSAASVCIIILTTISLCVGITNIKGKNNNITAQLDSSNEDIKTVILRNDDLLQSINKEIKIKVKIKKIENVTMNPEFPTTKFYFELLDNEEKNEINKDYFIMEEIILNSKEAEEYYNILCDGKVKISKNNNVADLIFPEVNQKYEITIILLNNEYYIAEDIKDSIKEI